MAIQPEAEKREQTSNDIYTVVCALYFYADKRATGRKVASVRSINAGTVF
jgi:hypothetical protein